MPDYAAFLLNSPARVKQLDLIEISHPNFTQTYRLVRNKVGGVTVTIDAVSRVFSYYPLRITNLGAHSDLEYGIKLDLGDLGAISSVELDAVIAANGLQTKPTVRYWAFRSDDLSAPMVGPITLQVTDIPISAEGMSFEAAAPTLDMNRTGEMYLLSRFPMLAGLL